MKKVLVGSLVSLALVAGFVVNAKDGHGKMGGNPMKMFKKLDLTEEQETQIKAIFKKDESNKEAKMKMHKAFKERKTVIVQAATFDEAAATALATEKSEMMKSKMLEKMRNHNQAWNLLTPEQQIEAQERMAKFHKKMEKKMGKNMKNGHKDDGHSH